MFNDSACENQDKPKRIYKSFHVAGDTRPANLCVDLNKKIDSLLKFGWVIERIDCVDNVYGIWRGDERKYYPTKDYIILASIQPGGITNA